MSRWGAVWVAVVAACAVGCGTDPGARSPEDPGPDPEPESCAAGDRQLEDGSCLVPGVPASECAEGFEHDGLGACSPILAAQPCATGQLAIPGDAACRDIADCGAAPYGDAPADASTQHVDGSYAGGDSDGTAERPWKTVKEAVAAADAGALVAIAEGSYVGDLDLAKGVRLWGRCPQLVELVGDDPAFTAVAITANDVELHALAVTGVGYAVVLSGAKGVLLDRVWIHDTGNRGMQVYDELGETSVTLRDSLVERTQRAGMLVAGSAATLERTVVRDVQSITDTESGWGVTTTDSDARRSTLALVRSVIDNNRGIGVSVWASDATIEGSVLRGTQPTDAGTLGRALAVTEGEDGERASVTVRGSVIERNHEVGVAVEGSDLIMEATTVRDMAPLEGAPLPVDVRGIAVQPGGFTGAPGSLVVRRSLIDRNMGTGIFVGISTAEIESVLVRDTRPQPPVDEGGMGIYLRDHASATIRHSVVEQSVVAGISIVASEATIEASAVKNTRAAASGLFGDGIVVLSHQASIARATVADTLVQASQRAGIGNFAGVVMLDGSTLECNAIDLDGETKGSEVENGTFDFQAGATNVCRCEAEIACLVQSANLAPPEL